MIQELKQINRFHTSILLLAMSLFSFGLTLLRYQVTESKMFLFLNWNLFLAFLPWAISTYLLIKKKNKGLYVFILIGSWLLLFPNALYICTDLIHLRLASTSPIWFDLIVILSFAWTGLVFGFVSLMDIQTVLSHYIHPKLAYVISILFLFLGAFGVYLGRFLRWNSWDIISNPGGLFKDIVDRFADPLSHPGTWGMTLLMGILLNMMYFSFTMNTKNLQAKISIK